MHRTQILLEDAQYERLRQQSKASATGIGELVRRAVDQVYGSLTAQDRLKALDASFGTVNGGRLCRARGRRLRRRPAPRSGPTAARHPRDVIVVDTSVLIDHLRGRAEAREALRRAVEQDHLLTASVLTKIEITAGMRNVEAGAVQTLFRAVEWLPVTDAIADQAGVLARRFRRSHDTIDVVDYVIAATAQSHGAEVGR